MVSFARGIGRVIAGGMAAGATGVAVLFTGAGAAGADPGRDAPDPAPSSSPNCTAADLAQVSTGVDAAMSAYLFTHPDVNAEFTSLKGPSRSDIRDQLGQYLDANPQTHADLDGIRQPLIDFQNRCR